MAVQVDHAIVIVSVQLRCSFRSTKPNSRKQTYIYVYWSNAKTGHITKSKAATTLSRKGFRTEAVGMESFESKPRILPCGAKLRSMVHVGAFTILSLCRRLFFGASEREHFRSELDEAKGEDL